MLMAHEGDKHAVVRQVAQHFACKFGCDVPVDVDAAFHVLADDEPLFSLEEVVEGVQSMKTHKTTGASKMSVELFQCLAAYEKRPDVFVMYSMISCVNLGYSCSKGYLLAGSSCSPRNCKCRTLQCCALSFFVKFWSSFSPNFALLDSWHGGQLPNVALAV